MKRKVGFKRDLGFLFSMIVILILPFLVTGCAKKESVKEKVSLRLSWIIEAHAAGYYVALEKGYYSNEGLDVSISLGGIDFPPVKMVASGSDDFGSESGGETIILARAQEIPVKAIGVIQPGGAPAVISIKKTGITSPYDLKGKKIAVAYGKPVEYVYRALLAKAGVDEKSVEESVFKFDITPLLDGRIDAFTGFKTNQPFIIKSKGYEPVVIDPDKYGVKSYGLTLFTSEKMIKEKPETVENFLRATLKGWNYAFSNPDEATDITLKFTEKLQYDRNIEIEKLKAIANTAKTPGLPFGLMEEKVWQEMVDRLIHYNIIKKKVDVKTVFTNDFIKE